jgi:hypothetical protein
MKGPIMAALVVSCGLALAQRAQAQEAPEEHKMTAKEHSMTGCLKSGTEPNTYMITNIEGKGPKTIGIVSSTTDLAPHVGHKIAITGTAVSAMKAEKEKNVPKAEHYMKVTAIKMISETCP